VTRLSQSANRGPHGNIRSALNDPRAQARRTWFTAFTMAFARVSGRANILREPILQGQQTAQPPSTCRPDLRASANDQASSRTQASIDSHRSGDGGTRLPRRRPRRSPRQRLIPTSLARSNQLIPLVAKVVGLPTPDRSSPGSAVELGDLLTSRLIESTVCCASSATGPPDSRESGRRGTHRSQLGRADDIGAATAPGWAARAARIEERVHRRVRQPAAVGEFPGWLPRCSRATAPGKPGRRRTRRRSRPQERIDHTRDPVHPHRRGFPMRRRHG
jgi:hypothetical protein